AVGVAIGALVGLHLPYPAAQVVVLINAGGRRQPFQHRPHVLEQQRLVLIEHYRGRGVLGEDRNPALRDPGAPDHVRDLVGDVAAIDRPTHGGRKRHLGRLTAFGTNHLVELLGATGAPNVAVDRPAVGTAGRLVLESLGSVELLLTDGKDEIETTVTARHS